MADCIRCGRKLPATLFGRGHGLCSHCRQAEQDEVQPGGHVSQLIPMWRMGPTVTMVLIGINAAVYLVMVLSGASPTDPSNEQLIRWGADFGPFTLGPEPWRALTSVFVHIGIFHILMNMWALWNLGRMAEQIYDKGTYLGAYLLCGIGGSIASLAWEPRVVSAGASGAIFGVAGLLITTFWLGQLPLPRGHANAVLQSLVGFAGFNLLYGAAIPGISNSAHIGGLFTGLVLGGLMAPRLTRDPRESQGLRWLILLGASVALGMLFQFVKERVF